MTPVLASMRSAPVNRHSGSRPSAVILTLAACILLPAPIRSQATNVFPASGNVGIGTTNPQSRLEISGTGSDGAGNGDLRVTGTGTIAAGIQLNASGNGGRPYSILSTQNSTGIPGSFGIYDSTTGSYRLVISPSGNVGIGTTNPGNILSVSGQGDNIPALGANGGKFSLLNAGLYGLVGGVTNTGQVFFQSQRVDGTAAAYTMLLQPTGGNVGIGTTNPATKLSVNGTITTKEVIVTNTGWSDYVFKPAYQLKPLKELAAYIKANHHLPEIPSDAEVQERGVSVGEMQSKLLAKVEELTLHMIQAEERNDRLEEQNRDLRRQVQEQHDATEAIRRMMRETRNSSSVAPTDPRVKE